MPTSLSTPSSCPRCGGPFDCGAASGHCDCFDIPLSDEQRAALASRFQGCLCLACLRELSRSTDAADLSAPA